MMPTLLCVPIMVSDASAALADASAARDAGADLVELRLDNFVEAQFEQGSDALAAVLSLVNQCPLACIVTCRPSWEGGFYEGDESERIALLESLVTHDHAPSYVDIELGAFTRTTNLATRLRSARQDTRLHARLIISIHDFATRPADLTRRLIAIDALHLADVAKIAFRARSLRDCLELFEIVRGGHRPTIALGMGEFGLMSRILAPACGALLTFASLRDESATAPGQPTIATLINTYRVRNITHDTLVYGVIGWPVSQSLSPLVHNAGFEAAQHNAVYIPLPIASGQEDAETYVSFKATLLSLAHDPHLNFAGASVTIPHKQHLVTLAREQGWTLDPLSQACGAGNTLTRLSDGTWHVSNTDAPAAVDALARALNSLHGTRIAIIGAGGAASSIALALAERGAQVMIVNRTHEHAAALAASLNSAGSPSVQALPLKDLTAADALINCTPVGMCHGPAPDALPIPAEQLSCIRGLKVVQDTVYNPICTPLLKQAEQCGIQTIDGVEMFVGQAAAQFTQWTGKPAPKNLFERVVRESLTR